LPVGNQKVGVIALFFNWAATSGKSQDERPQ
jgi:hypothetical protein